MTDKGVPGLLLLGLAFALLRRRQVVLASPVPAPASGLAPVNGSPSGLPFAPPVPEGDRVRYQYRYIPSERIFNLTSTGLPTEGDPDWQFLGIVLV